MLRHPVDRSATLLRTYAGCSVGIGLLTLLLLAACANPVPPQGGPRDETPPQLDTAASTPNYQTNFRKQPIELAFDEWVQLDDIFNQLIISPPLPEKPEVKIKKRSVILTFPENIELRPDATYTINFGEGVKDLTEGNPAELRFVFATGEALDSLNLSGVVVDARSGEPVEEVRFMLYEDLADSVVYTERPFYAGNTDEAGRFEINNIKEGVFKGFALGDAGGKNYLYDSGEAIAFPDSFIVMSDTLPAPALRLRLFEETGNIRLLEEDTEQFGLVKLTYNEAVEDLRARSLDGPPLITQADGDTLKLWYAETRAKAWRLVVQRDTFPGDTVRVPARNSEAFLRQARLRRAGPEPNKVAPNKPYTLQFNHPLAQVDTNRLTLYADTTRNPVRPRIALDSITYLEMRVRTDWIEEAPYELVLLPGAVYDIFGLPNQDTIRQAFQVQPRKDFGNLLLTLNGLDSLEHYVVQLLNNNRIVAERQVAETTEYQEDFPLLPPAEYTLQVITDWNANGQWDTGNYETRRQPEPIYRQQLEQLRANWDVEARVRLGGG